MATTWRWKWIVAPAAALAVAPVALSIGYQLPPVVYALTPMALYVIVWTVFRQLDAPPAPAQPRRRDGPPREAPPRPSAPGARPRQPMGKRRPVPAELTER